MRKMRSVGWMLCASLCMASAHAQTQGVKSDEVVIGSIQDLSGPVAMLGQHFRSGMQMRVDEINAAGGIHGRKLRLVVEDSAWDPKKAVLAARKLMDSDNVFAMVNNLGSSIAAATIPMALQKNVPYLFPAAPIPVTYEPHSKLKFAIDLPYDTQTAIGVRYLVKQRGFKRVGSIYQDDDFGKDVLKGLDQSLKELGLQGCTNASFKRGDTDFSSQVALLRKAECDLVVIGGSTRETIGMMGEARKLGWTPGFMITNSAYSAQLHVLGGQIVENLFATVYVPHPYAEGANLQLAKWLTTYKERFNHDATPFSVMGYVKIDLLVEAMKRAGVNLSPDTLAAALEAAPYANAGFGIPEYRFSATNHLGIHEARIDQVKNGRWVNIAPYMR